MKGNEHHSKFLLTHREREVFELLVQDKTTRDIAGLLFISEKTVRNHISKEMWFEIHLNFNVKIPWYY
ncbi:helix-turn-helix transcriptional regulator [Paenibacillus sp. FSL R10-2199]|uniref:helix-turn-helix transcriptional regulator n=1 Tax=Paenibacillus sp. FSL R10-2199 TaxID=2975348 RepID=UPI0030F9A145